MRNVALICATVVIVLGAVVGVALISEGQSSSGGHSTGGSSRARPTVSVSVSKPAPPDRYSRASAGLRRAIAAHVPTTARPVVRLASCPFTSGTMVATTALHAGGLAHSLIRGTGKAYAEVSRWQNSGDSGTAITCRFAGPRQFVAAAFTHIRTVTSSPIFGFDGPYPLDGGRLYRSIDKDTCATYWLPPASDYVISVQYAAPYPVRPAPCGAALRAVQPTIFAGLIRLDS